MPGEVGDVVGLSAARARAAAAGSVSASTADPANVSAESANGSGSESAKSAAPIGTATKPCMTISPAWKRLFAASRCGRGVTAGTRAWAPPSNAVSMLLRTNTATTSVHSGR